MIDLHAHILPGLDDGPTSMTEALEMCRIAAQDGTTIIVATPHMRSGPYDVTRERILETVRSLREALSGRGVEVEILPGADVGADGDLLDDVRRGRVMTVADGGRYIMLELAEDVIPRGFDELLFGLQLNGLRPILSHPERNLAVQEDPDVLLPMVRRGMLAQVTAASITGSFGERAERCAMELLRRGVVHVVASDAHSVGHRPPGLARARAVVERVVGTAEARAIFEERPRRIIAGDSVEVPAVREPAPRRRRAWLRLFGGTRWKRVER